jgi:halimadienyl-diphosphate synthase
MALFSLDKEVIDLLKCVGPGTMSSLAYDTAWVARLGEIDWELSNRALAWLTDNQLEDGSWGAREPFYYHDRVISTLAAMIALTYRGRRTQDKEQIERGLIALEKIIDGADEGLLADPNGGTVGFEMIVPTLVAEAENLGLIKQQGERILGRIAQRRPIKLNLLQGKVINRNMTAAFSSEMAGSDGHQILDVENLQESNGSVGHSPSASAYLALQVRPKNTPALEYLRKTVSPSGGVPDLFPFDVFEKSWVLWNLAISGSWDEITLGTMKSLTGELNAAWKPGVGIGLSTGYSIPDGDDTSLVFEVLHRFGYDPDIEALLAFEEGEHFRTYHLEANSSNSVNIHMLGALRQANFEYEANPVQKTINHLQHSLIENTHWFDKWHLSPYYATAHAIIACAGYANALVENSINWIISTQRSDGSWGCQTPTAEETAYCIQAIQVWRQNGGKISKDVINRARSWLERNIEPPFPPLWIGKGLYSPEIVVQSAILSALHMAREG